VESDEGAGNELLHDGSSTSRNRFRGKRVCRFGVGPTNSWLGSMRADVGANMVYFVNDEQPELVQAAGGT
jgi:hypothetical protein